LDRSLRNRRWLQTGASAGDAGSNAAQLPLVAFVNDTDLLPVQYGGLGVIVATNTDELIQMPGLASSALSMKGIAKSVRSIPVRRRLDRFLGETLQQPGPVEYRHKRQHVFDVA
jgi:hypothetical protein